ncbi:MAG: methyltransferase domain-containing protein [Alphaproteobacteria bacterium]|nr:methyltransferase domain-containing protein [Alphaproteobacteria bacterium]
MHYVARPFSLFEDYAIDLARRAGSHNAGNVLELAAGTGIASRQLRDALPAQARLVVTDLNSPMLEVAERKFAAGEIAELRQVDAMSMPFEDAEFDLIVCQFGVMFFPDKQDAFREARRVLGKEGVYLFNVWDDMSANPFSEIAYEVGARFFPADPPGFYQKPFSYSDPEIVKSDLAAAGFRDINWEPVALAKEVADWTLFARGTVYGSPLLEEINSRQDVEPEEVMDAIRIALRERFGHEPTTMPLRAKVYSARAS